MAVAEETKKPVILYPAGELGSRLDSVQSGIRKIVRYATRWKAMLLVDEADVFLESRQSGGQANLERNALVAGSLSIRLYPDHHVQDCLLTVWP